MARARNIKPGFFANEELVEADFGTRLLFIGLWTIADRAGRLEDRPKRIKMQLFPADDLDVELALCWLHGHRFIERYRVDDALYIQIINFEKHQNPHYKEEPSHIPAPDGHVDSPVISFGVSEQKRQEIFDRDKRKCRKCGSSDHLSLDHIIPRSRGGSEDDDNLQTLCMSCNASKNNRLAREDTSTSGQRRVNVGSTSAKDRVGNHADSLIPSTDTLIPGSTDSGFSDTSESSNNTTARAREKPPPPEIHATYEHTLNGVMSIAVKKFASIDKQLTEGWLRAALLAAEVAVGPLSRSQLGQGIDLTADQVRRATEAGKVHSPRAFAQKVLIDYLTEQKGKHHAA